MGMTTALSLPYPEGADPPRGDQQIRALAEAVEAAIEAAATRARPMISARASGTLAAGWQTVQLSTVVASQTRGDAGVFTLTGNKVRVLLPGLYLASCYVSRTGSVETFYRIAGGGLPEVVAGDMPTGYGVAAASGPVLVSAVPQDFALDLYAAAASAVTDAVLRVVRLSA